MEERPRGKRATQASWDELLPCQPSINAAAWAHPAKKTPPQQTLHCCSSLRLWAGCYSGVDRDSEASVNLGPDLP